MSTSRDFDRIARAWLADGPVELSDRVLDDALEEVHLTRQRRARVPWRLRTMSSPFKLAAAAAAVIAVLLTGSFVLNRGSGPPTGSSPTPSLIPTSPPATASPAPTRVAFLPGSGRVEAGGYLTDQILPPTTFHLECCFEVALHTNRLLVLAETGLARYIVLTNPEGVVEPATGEPGPLPADLVDWLVEHPGLEVGAPSDVTFGGLSGREVVGAPRMDATFDVNGHLPLTSGPLLNDTFIVSDQRFRLIVLDGPTAPLMVQVLARADKFDEFSPKAQAVLESLRFGD